ncbi:hypothetical protein, partial [Phaeovulum sp. W22_SRMD_FR3]|uniref:hypothetical protein n=1 Tax=Phaeovulum sp. W22_SRMD_FR3 TaxID=3240274 RepID=UPI003F9AA8BA
SITLPRLGSGVRIASPAPISSHPGGSKKAAFGRPFAFKISAFSLLQPGAAICKSPLTEGEAATRN